MPDPTGRVIQLLVPALSREPRSYRPSLHDGLCLPTNGDTKRPRLLGFDIYDTLVDWQRGILRSNRMPDHLLRPLPRAATRPANKTPDVVDSNLLAGVHPMLMMKPGLSSLPRPDQAEPLAFPGTLDAFDALKQLVKRYPLVVLRNVNRNSFARTDTGSLQGVDGAG